LESAPTFWKIALCYGKETYTLKKNPIFWERVPLGKEPYMSGKNSYISEKSPKFQERGQHLRKELHISEKSPYILH